MSNTSVDKPTIWLTFRLLAKNENLFELKLLQLSNFGGVGSTKLSSHIHICWPLSNIFWYNNFVLDLIIRLQYDKEFIAYNLKGY